MKQRATFAALDELRLSRYVPHLCCIACVLELLDSRLLCELGLVDAEPRLAVLPAVPSPDTTDPRRPGLPGAPSTAVDPDAEPRLTDERRPPSAFEAVAFCTDSFACSVDTIYTHTHERRRSQTNTLRCVCLSVELLYMFLAHENRI